jgi:8-oxo-dGTP diphosphatase
MPYTYQYPRPALTVDCVIFAYDHRLGNADVKVLLIERDIEPYRSKWALPGGFAEMKETLEAAAKRELREETGLVNIHMEQFFTFDEVDRDPRGRVISVAYFGLTHLAEASIVAASDAQRAMWFSLRQLPELAFDHATIIAKALERLRGKIRTEPIAFELLPERFTLTELQTLYETILQTTFDKRNFRKKIETYQCLRTTDETQHGESHRAARFYTFDQQHYKKMAKHGFVFEV